MDEDDAIPHGMSPDDDASSASSFQGNLALSIALGQFVARRIASVVQSYGQRAEAPRGVGAVLTRRSLREPLGRAARAALQGVR